MNQEIKAQWIKDLRSGAFPQGHGELVSDNGDHLSYCCLGVLCHQAHAAKVLDDYEWEEI